jgi:ubiquinone/menaquinone biosynthesis C-methylase UbiE
MAECKNISDPKYHQQDKSTKRYLDKDIIIKALNIRPGQIILDVGCGNGYMVKAFAVQLEGRGKVYALDSDEISIETLLLQTKGTVIEPFVGDITKQTKLESSSIDLIYLSTVFHGFSENQATGFLKEVKRLLKRKGKLAVLEIEKQDTPFGPSLEIRFSPKELKEIITLKPTDLVKVGQYFYMQIFEN